MLLKGPEVRRDCIAIAGAITCSTISLISVFSPAFALADEKGSEISNSAQESTPKANQYDDSDDLKLPGGLAVSKVLKRVQYELDNGKLTQESVNEVAELTQQFSGNYKLHLYYGLCLDEVGLPDEALAQFRQADQLGPRDPRGTVGILNHLLSRGDQQAANLLLDEALKRFPNTPEINYFMGKVLKDNGRYPEAEKVFLRAYRSGHKIFRLPTELGELMEGKNPKLAVQLAEEDLAKHPNYYRALEVKGIGLMNMGAFTLAIEPFKNLFNQAPAYGRSAEYYLRCLFWSGNYKEALQPGFYYLAQQAQEVRGELPAEYVLIKILRTFSADLAEKQLELFYTTISRSSKSIKEMVKPAFHYYLASILERVPRPQMAIAEWQKYLASDPNSVEALYHLGMLLENHCHDYAGAYKLYAQAHGLAPHHSDIYKAYVRMEERLAHPGVDWAQSFRDWLCK